MDTLLVILSSLIRRARSLVIGTVLVAVAVFALVVLVKKRAYRAEVVLAAVSNQKLPGGLGGLAAMAGAALPTSGLTPTPDLLAQFSVSRGVLLAVAFSPVRPGGPAVIDSLLRGDERPKLHRIEKYMRDMMRTSIDRKTGLISVSVDHPDSALARLVLQRTVSEASEAVTRTSRAQATVQRRGQEARVDSAARELAQREQELLQFSRANRAAAPFSVAAVQRARLERAVDLANDVYGQAVNDREAARAKELEDTPAVIVVDDVPRELRPMPRRASLIAAGVAFLYFLVASTVFVTRDLLAAARASADPSIARFVGLFGRRRGRTAA